MAAASGPRHAARPGRPDPPAGRCPRHARTRHRA